MTNPMKWFFGGVLIVFLDAAFTKRGIIDDPQCQFGGLVFILCCIVAVCSFMADNARRDEDARRARKDKK